MADSDTSSSLLPQRTRCACCREPNGVRPKTSTTSVGKELTPLGHAASQDPHDQEEQTQDDAQTAEDGHERGAAPTVRDAEPGATDGVGFAAGLCALRAARWAADRGSPGWFVSRSGLGVGHDDVARRFQRRRLRRAAVLRIPAILCLARATHRAAMTGPRVEIRGAPRRWRLARRSAARHFDRAGSSAATLAQQSKLAASASRVTIEGILAFLYV